MTMLVCSNCLFRQDGACTEKQHAAVGTPLGRGTACAHYIPRVSHAPAGAMPHRRFAPQALSSHLPLQVDPISDAE